ncbi:hypothetical protein DIPPA_15688 [Diplonema papillatum]|nr:hypothetical protein DIPPA_15688 [Diplonema papillatum]
MPAKGGRPGEKAAAAAAQGPPPAADDRRVVAVSVEGLIDRGLVPGDVSIRVVLPQGENAAENGVKEPPEVTAAECYGGRWACAATGEQVETESGDAAGLRAAQKGGRLLWKAQQAPSGKAAIVPVDLRVDIDGMRCVWEKATLRAEGTTRLLLVRDGHSDNDPSVLYDFRRIGMKREAPAELVDPAHFCFRAPLLTLNLPQVTVDTVRGVLSQQLTVQIVSKAAAAKPPAQTTPPASEKKPRAKAAKEKEKAEPEDAGTVLCEFSFSLAPHVVGDVLAEVTHEERGAATGKSVQRARPALPGFPVLRLVSETFADDPPDDPAARAAARTPLLSGRQQREWLPLCVTIKAVSDIPDLNPIPLSKRDECSLHAALGSSQADAPADPNGYEGLAKACNGVTVAASIFPGAQGVQTKPVAHARHLGLHHHALYLLGEIREETGGRIENLLSLYKYLFSANLRIELRDRSPRVAGTVGDGGPAAGAAAGAEGFGVAAFSLRHLLLEDAEKPEATLALQVRSHRSVIDAEPVEPAAGAPDSTPPASSSDSPGGAARKLLAVGQYMSWGTTVTLKARLAARFPELSFRAAAVAAAAEQAAAAAAAVVALAAAAHTPAAGGGEREHSKKAAESADAAAAAAAKKSVPPASSPDSSKPALSAAVVAGLPSCDDGGDGGAGVPPAVEEGCADAAPVDTPYSRLVAGGSRGGAEADLRRLYMGPSAAEVAVPAFMRDLAGRTGINGGLMDRYAAVLTGCGAAAVRLPTPERIDPLATPPRQLSRLVLKTRYALPSAGRLLHAVMRTLLSLARATPADDVTLYPPRTVPAAEPEEVDPKKKRPPPAEKTPPPAADPLLPAAAAGGVLPAVVMGGEGGRGVVHVTAGDVVSGFEVIDGEFRILVVEGLTTTALAAVLDAVHENVDEVDMRAGGVAVVFNPHIPFPARSYHAWPPLVPQAPPPRAEVADSNTDSGGVGNRVRRIRLAPTLTQIANTLSNYVKRRVPEGVLSAVKKLRSLVSIRDMSDALLLDAFPPASDIILLERMYGTTLSTYDVCGFASFYPFTQPLPPDAGAAAATRAAAAPAPVSPRPDAALPGSLAELAAEIGRDIVVQGVPAAGPAHGRRAEPPVRVDEVNTATCWLQVAHWPEPVLLLLSDMERPQRCVTVEVEGRLVAMPGGPPVAVRVYRWSEAIKGTMHAAGTTRNPGFLAAKQAAGAKLKYQHYSRVQRQLRALEQEELEKRGKTLRREEDGDTSGSECSLGSDVYVPPRLPVVENNYRAINMLAATTGAYNRARGKPAASVAALAKTASAKPKETAKPAAVGSTTGARLGQPSAPPPPRRTTKAKPTALPGMVVSDAVFRVSRRSRGHALHKAQGLLEDEPRKQALRHLPLEPAPLSIHPPAAGAAGRVASPKREVSTVYYASKSHQWASLENKDKRSILPLREADKTGPLWR